MNRRFLRILYPVLILLTGIALAVISAAFSSTLRIDPGLDSAVLYQASTPTPAAKAVSNPGSTDGLVVMSIIIVIIVLAPIIFRKSVWTK